MKAELWGLCLLSLALLYYTKPEAASNYGLTGVPPESPKKVWIIDAHRHIGNAGFLGSFPARQVIAEMAKHGIDKTLVLPMGDVPKTHEEDNRRLLRINKANDDYFNKGIVSDEVRQLQRYKFDHTEVIEAMRRYPGRLIGVYMINPWLGDAELAVAERAIRQQGFCGLKLHPMANAFRVDDQVVDPVLRLGERLGIPVMIHSSFGLGAEPWRSAKLAERFPRVNIILYHVGAQMTEGLSMANQGIKAAKEHPNIFLELSDTKEDAIRKILREVPPEQILYGSDAPWDGWATRFDLVHRLTDSNQELQQLVMGGNIARLLKLQ